MSPTRSFRVQTLLITEAEIRLNSSLAAIGEFLKMKTNYVVVRSPIIFQLSGQIV